MNGPRIIAVPDRPLLLLLNRHSSHFTLELVMKEALCIQSTPTDSRFNRDGGYELPDCWFVLNRKLRGGAIVGHRAPLACAALRNYPPKIN